MDFILLDQNQKILYKTDIIEMLEKADNDFVPPLSKRGSTVDNDLSGKTSCKNGILDYYNEMNKQPILASFEKNELLGFVSFRQNYKSDIITEQSFPNIYISTVLLKPEARGKRLTSRMYEHLFCNLYPECDIFTRTWSTNYAHIKILEKFNFILISRIENDRGDGIDTVYFKKDKNK